jgi:uncharacterized protein YutE (UPF0331/DUF86 family)
MREIEKIIEELGNHDFWEHALILDLLKRAYNAGLQDAADNAKIMTSSLFQYSIVDRESILKLKLIDGTSKK